MNAHIWGVLKWLVRPLVIPHQGPAVTIAPSSIRDGGGQRIYPGRITFENSGTAAAFNVECETRRYYDPIIPPTCDKKRTFLSAALKPGDHFTLELLDESGSRHLADLCNFEIFVRYGNAAKQGFLAYVRVGMVGEVEYRDHAVNPLRRVILPAETWFRHLLPNLWIHVKVRARPKLYRLLVRLGTKTSVCSSTL